MESLACGTPVVAFNIGGNADMIDHKLNGYLAKAKDTEDLAQGINYCLNNNVDNKLSEASRTKVLKCFKAVVVGSLYTELYKEII